MDTRFNIPLAETGVEMFKFLNSSYEEEKGIEKDGNVHQVPKSSDDLQVDQEDVINIQRMNTEASSGGASVDHELPGKKADWQELPRDELVSKMESYCRLTSDPYLQEVNRAIYGDTTGHPPSGSAAYFKAAQEYALYGCKSLEAAAIHPGSFLGGLNDASGSNVRNRSRFLPHITLPSTDASMANNYQKRTATPATLRKSGGRNAGAGRPRHFSGHRSSNVAGAAPNLAPSGFGVKQDNLTSVGGTFSSAGDKQRQPNTVFPNHQELSNSRLQVAPSTSRRASSQLLKPRQYKQRPS